jgi:antitoxin component YwqK of YwqJK toxin-antitoxin module
MRTRASVWVLASILLGCSGKPADPAATSEQPPVVSPKSDEPKPDEPTPDEPKPDEPKPQPEDTFALGPGKLPDPLAREQIDAPIPTELPKLEFWKKGDAACAPGQHLQGAVPPAGFEIRCVDERGRWTGMEARFHEDADARLQSIGTRDDGKMVGVWLWFHPSGAKAAEHPYVAGQLHGTMRRFAESGQEIESGEYRAGRAWGLFVQHDEAGTELVRSQLESGTGLLVMVSTSGRTESEYVEGLLHGSHRRFDADGRLLQQSHWSGGEMHGLESYWDEHGRRLREGQWQRGKQHGKFVSWQNGEEIERSVWIDGEQRSRQLVRAGQPLAPLPPATACDTDAGLSAMLGTARGRGLPDEHACVSRAPLFPGVIVVGDFAYDRGCADEVWVIDCKLVEPPPTDAVVLARAGWANADGEQRLELAREYMRELGMVWSGSVTSDPEPPQWTARADGSVEAIVWVVAPAGMRRGRELDKVRWEFAADGTLTRTQLEHRSEMD